MTNKLTVEQMEELNAILSDAEDTAEDFPDGAWLQYLHDKATEFFQEQNIPNAEDIAHDYVIEYLMAQDDKSGE